MFLAPTSLAEVAARPRRLPSWVLPTDDPLAVAIVLAARDAIGECEVPASSNRGPLVDAWNADRGAPLGSYWCASFAAAMWAQSGAPTAGVGHDPSCDQLMHWCVQTSRFSKLPALGAFVFYGVPGDAQHVGIIQRVTPYLMSIEGNAAWGGAFSRNGEAVVARRVDPTRVLGYGHVRPRA